MQEEIQGLNHNQTRVLMPTPDDVKLISRKWVCKVKTRLTTRSRGTRRASWLVDSYSSMDSMMKTFSLTNKITSGRVKALKLWQMNVKSSFLHDEVDQGIYVEQLKRYEIMKSNCTFASYKNLSMD